MAKIPDGHFGGKFVPKPARGTAVLSPEKQVLVQWLEYAEDLDPDQEDSGLQQLADATREVLRG